MRLNFPGETVRCWRNVTTRSCDRKARKETKLILRYRILFILSGKQDAFCAIYTGAQAGAPT